MCVMDFVSYQKITLRVIGRSVNQRVCLLDVYMFVPFHSMTKFPLLKGKIHTFFKCFYYRAYSVVGIIISFNVCEIPSINL